MTEQSAEQQAAVRKTLIKSAIGLVFMFAFAFALVPLYQVICDITGLNGNTSNLKEEHVNIDTPQVDTSREVSLQFLAVNNKHVSWEFEPITAEAELNPGEIQTFYYRIKNLTGTNKVVQAIPSVSPNEAASYLRKMECFCFNAQPLAAGEEAELFVSLYIHDSLPEDVGTMTLAYSLFDITEQSDFEKISTLDQKGRGEATTLYKIGDQEHDHDHDHGHSH